MGAVSSLYRMAPAEAYTAEQQAGRLQLIMREMILKHGRSYVATKLYDYQPRNEDEKLVHSNLLSAFNKDGYGCSKES